MRKYLLIGLLVLLFAASLGATGKSEKPALIEERVVTTIPLASYATESWYTAMNDAFTSETGIQVNVQLTPGTNAEQVVKVNLDLLSGGTIDVIPTLGPRDLSTRLEAGFFAPLKKMTEEAGVDVSGIWGKYIDYDATGEFYSIPNKQEIYNLYYNKEMFDRAKVPYPTAPWSWAEYEEIARKITQALPGEYGTLMRLETPHVIFKAMQNQVPLYKEDGTSNFDDPAFAESLKWFYEMGNVKKYQMSARQLNAESASWNYWATVDSMAMFIQGNWFARLLNSQDEYPRSWDYGVVAIPADSKKNNFVSMTYASVNKNAAHPQEALQYVLWLGQNQWKFEKGIPALVNLTEAEQEEIFKSTADASRGSITVKDLNLALVDNGLNVINADIVGPAADQYNQIILEEVGRYCTDQQSLEQTTARIKSRMDDVLRNL